MIRETTSYERAVFYYSEKGPMYFAFRLKIKGDLTLERVKGALTKIRIQYPLTAVRMEIADDKKQYIRTDGVPGYPLIFKNDFSGDWTDEVIEELKTPFDNRKGPMVRFRFLKNGINCDLIVIFHHAVGDGVGAALFIRDLATYLGDPEKPACDPAPGSWDAVLHKIIRPEIEEEILKRELPDFFVKKEYLNIEIKPRMEPVFPSPNFVLLPLAFSEEETTRFIALSRKAGVTVHAYLGALILKIFGEEFGRKEGYKRTIQCPVNFRPQLKEEAVNYLGLYNGLITAESDCSPERPLEEIASEIGRTLREQVDSFDPLQRYYNFMTHYLTGVKDPEAFYDSRTESGPGMNYDFSFSNIGRVDIARQYNDLTVEELYGPTFSATKGERVIGVLTQQGRLSLTMIYDAECFDHDRGKHIWNRFREEFLRIVN